MTMNSRPAWPEPLYIFGAGGHAREAAWLARTIWGSSLVLQHLVDDPVHVLPAPDGTVPRLLGETEPGWYIAAVGNIGLRRRVAATMDALGFRPATMVHPGALVSPSVTIGDGVIVAAGCVITTDVIIREHVHVNVACSVSHDVELGDFSTLSPGAHIAGHVVLEPGAFIGAGATVINGEPNRPLVVGNGAIVGAGACVIDDVAPESIVVGVPAVQKDARR